MFRPGPLTGRLLTLCRFLFFLAVVAVFVAAILPTPDLGERPGGDKVLHILAFYGLTLLAVMAFPSAHLLKIATLLSVFGAVIEVVQGLSFIGRDRDIWDWVADNMAIAAVLCPLVLSRWRTRT